MGFSPLSGVLDDYSRWCCHAQWYLAEEAENTAHTFMQAFLKGGLPRALMTDCGGAYNAQEITTGLRTLSIDHEPTLPYSPYQNGKQECFWGHVEGWLLAMLAHIKDLTFSELAYLTAAWLEEGYNRTVHSEIRQTPLQRFTTGRDVGRPAPSMETLKGHFCKRDTRKQRLSDNTITIEGIRYEIPSRYDALHTIHIRYARWDLSRVELLDPLSRRPIGRIYPQDKQRNADGIRRVRKPALPQADLPKPPAERYPPLLRELVGKYAASGLPPAYLPKDEVNTREENPHE